MAARKATAVEDASTLTARYQTTIPASVRRALGLGRGDRLRYEVRGDGEVVLSRVDPKEDGPDPVVDAYLAFLATDMLRHPDRLQAMPSELKDRIEDLTADMDVDLEGDLEADPGEADD